MGKRNGLFLVLLAGLLSGCGGVSTVETVADLWDVPAMAVPREIVVELPGEAAEAVEESGRRYYYNEEYEIEIETLDSGDLTGTVKKLTGFPAEALTVMHREENGVDRYDFVWACAGEQGERLGKGVVLDDGTYHYCMTALRDAVPVSSSQIVWDQVFGSFSLG